mgnify:CR=1 FL=1
MRHQLHETQRTCKAADPCGSYACKSIQKWFEMYSTRACIHGHAFMLAYAAEDSGTIYTPMPVHPGSKQHCLHDPGNPPSIPFEVPVLYEA